MKAKMIKQKGIKALAWCSFLIAAIGGTVVVETPFGRAAQWVLGLLPWAWIPPVMLAIAVVGLIVDIFIDLVPNKMAIWSAIGLPTIAASVDGKLGSTVSHWCGQLLVFINTSLQEWITGSSTGLAVACIGGALVMARRVVRKSQAAGVV